jgi:lipoprotein-releasing system permease protein
MSIIGGLIGLFIGYIIIQLQYSFSLIMLTETLAYPVAITLKNGVIVFITIFILGTIASKIASSRINKSLIKIA